jgi:hypothetical protein
MTEVVTNFKPPKNPNAKRELKARDKRPGMSPEHLSLIRNLPSCVSGRKPCDPHHLRLKDERGVGLRATDRWAIPLTRDEHDHVHTFGSKRETIYFKALGFNPYDLANALWKNTGDLERMEKIVRAYLPVERQGRE